MSLFNRQFRDTETVYVLIFLVGISISALIISAVANIFTAPPVDWAEWVVGFSQNFATEIIGAIATYSLFELIIGRRNEQRRLVANLRVGEAAIAKNALEQLRDNGGLVDGSLNATDLSGMVLPEADMKNAQMQGANLDNADLNKSDLSKSVLEGTSLRNAKLNGANFWLANLQGANLQDANLNEADMRLADLQGAILRRATLKSAKLFQAKLETADFANADLRQAFLFGANLQGANLASAKLDGAHFDPNTILPDGSHWSERTDMSRFTNSDHPTFWQQNNDKGGFATSSFRAVEPPTIE
jgi:uncharacterized protein YjbI with pentapeptide repeats